MENRNWARLVAVSCSVVLLASALVSGAQEQKGNEKMVAKGGFDVKTAAIETAQAIAE